MTDDEAGRREVIATSRQAAPGCSGPKLAMANCHAIRGWNRQRELFEPSPGTDESTMMPRSAASAARGFAAAE